MAVATVWGVDHSCGHSKEVDLSKKPAGKRAGLAVWLKSQPCLDCVRKSEKKELSAEVKAEREAEQAEAEQFAEALELPDFTGSEKQRQKLIPWAFTSRHRLLKAGYEALVEEGDWDEEDFEGKVLVPARRIDSPGWWVDNKDADAADLEELVSTALEDESAVLSENPN